MVKGAFLDPGEITTLEMPCAPSTDPSDNHTEPSDDPRADPTADPATDRSADRFQIERGGRGTHLFIYSCV